MMVGWLELLDSWNRWISYIDFPAAVFFTPSKILFQTRLKNERVVSRGIPTEFDRVLPFDGLSSFVKIFAKKVSRFFLLIVSFPFGSSR